MVGNGRVAQASRAKKGLELGIVRQPARRGTATILGDLADPRGRDAAQCLLGGGAMVRQPDVTCQRRRDRLATVDAKGGFLRDRRRTPW